MADRILAETKFLRCIDRDGWAFVERPNASGVVTLIPVTRDRRLVLVEQFRIPVGRPVIELPSGLVGDLPGEEGEAMELAARRELLEEAGYTAGKLELLSRCTSSPGVTSEIVSLFLATELDKVGPGGGVGEEQIRVHEVALPEVRSWCKEREAEGKLVSVKVFAGLFFAGELVRG
jgi:ADP-ribose pyrophosphatase